MIVLPVVFSFATAHFLGYNLPPSEIKDALRLVIAFPMQHRLRLLIAGIAVILFIGLNCLFADKILAAQPTTKQEEKPPWLVVSLSQGGGVSSGTTRVFSVIQALSHNPNGKIVHFSKVTPELLAEMQPEFVILGPQGTPWCRYAGEKGVALQNFLWMVPLMAEQFEIPILGICGGHQALAMAFGGSVGPIRAGEEDCLPYVRERQRGICELLVETPDPIFSGIDNVFLIVQSHYDEVKTLPPGFVLLASDIDSPNQIMRHPTKPVYGIQGHPEGFRAIYPGGGILIRNFLEIARTYNRTVRKLTYAHASASPPRPATFKRAVSTNQKTDPAN